MKEQFKNIILAHQLVSSCQTGNLSVRVWKSSHCQKQSGMEVSKLITSQNTQIKVHYLFYPAGGTTPDGQNWASGFHHKDSETFHTNPRMQWVLFMWESPYPFSCYMVAFTNTDTTEISFCHHTCQISTSPKNYPETVRYTSQKTLGKK